jgi:hypothetical protein
MESSEGIRDRLLSRLPQPANLADYRREVEALLEKNEKRLRREKFGAILLWIYAVLFFILALEAPQLWHGGKYAGTTMAIYITLWLTSFGFLQLIYGATELLKHFINRTRVELLKETKQVQLQVLELHDLLIKQGHLH